MQFFTYMKTIKIYLYFVLLKTVNSSYNNLIPTNYNNVLYLEVYYINICICKNSIYIEIDLCLFIDISTKSFTNYQKKISTISKYYH